MFCTWMGLVTQSFKFPVPLSVPCITFLTYIYTWLFCIIILSCYFSGIILYSIVIFFYIFSILSCYFSGIILYSIVIFFYIFSILSSVSYFVSFLINKNEVIECGQYQNGPWRGLWFTSLNTCCLFQNVLILKSELCVVVFAVTGTDRVSSSHRFIKDF